MNTQEQIAANRDFCKSPFAQEREPSDQQKRLPQPPLCKPAQSEQRIALSRDFRPVMTETDFLTILQNRTSQRFYKDEESNRFGEIIMPLCGQYLPAAPGTHLRHI